ncbi:MAG: N-6 DNA methylase [Patescibacteria group bacterium]|jgi:type I restriction enzyme M protein
MHKDDIYNLSIERDTETLIDRTLENLGWVSDPKSHERNVYKQQPKTVEQKKALGGLRPDYVLYKSNSDQPIIVIEAKKTRKNIHEALKQGLDYAQKIKAPIVFATDGIFTKTLHIKTKKPLTLNGEELDELIKEYIALQYIDTSDVLTKDKKVIESRKELIGIFDQANDILRGEGLHAGVDRFSEFANLLFLKIISEREDLNEQNGVANVIPREFRWNFFKNKNDNELKQYINSIVLKYFRERFNDANIFTDLRIQNPERLKRIIDMLDPLSLIDTNADIKGDAFEYFLKSYSSGNSNDMGQYFTPRHIAKTLVKLLNPQLGEKVYDPFCGTGGMLTETFKYIHNRMPQNKNSDEILRKNTVYGRELTSIARIAKMNMILIGDGHSNIQQMDSLEHPVKNEYDVVITNIPFSQETEWGNLYDLPTKNGDSICLQHCLKSLNSENINSRAGIIVPEGFLFDSKFEKDREWLVEKFDLQTVVSLPSGVFLPYTPQKASILHVKIKDKSEKKEKIWFFDVKSDGYTLDNYRKPTKKNDLDNLLDGIHFDVLEIAEIRKKKYELLKSLYTANGIPSGRYKSVSLKSIATVTFGNSAPQDLDSFENGTYPFVRVSDLAKEHIAFNLKETRDLLNEQGIKGLRLFSKGTILFPKSGKSALKNHRGILGCNAYVVSHFACIIPNEDKVDPYYLLNCLINIKAQDILLNEGYPSIRRGTFEDLQIPLPPLSVQHDLVKEIREIVELENKVKLLKKKLDIKFEDDILEKQDDE